VKTLFLRRMFSLLLFVRLPFKCELSARGLKDPYRIEEIGCYVPGTPKVCYDPRGQEFTFVGAGVDVVDVWVDDKRLVYCSSYNGGLKCSLDKVARARFSQISILVR
jgi:hypothetical protein